MATDRTPGFWLRGPVEDMPGLLQPIAHALLQARVEVTEPVRPFPEDLLWERPAGLASVGFHLGQREGAPTKETLTAPRSVDRAQIPSTVIGLIFHAAEHTMRHTGQLLVTVKVLTASIA